MTRSKNGFLVATITTLALLSLWTRQSEGQVDDQLPAADIHQQHAMEQLENGASAVQMFLAMIGEPLKTAARSNSSDGVCELNAPLPPANRSRGTVQPASHWVEIKALSPKHPKPVIAQPEPGGSLLEPIVATQYRNSRQLESLVQANRELRRSVANLENQLTRFAMLQRAKLSDSEVRRMMNSVKENELHAQEVEKLHAELRSVDERIRQLRQKPIQAQPANYLEPVYLPEQPLEPMKFQRR